jgi:cytoskeletal protein CcmA (bactofilin family)
LAGPIHSASAKKEEKKLWDHLFSQGERAISLIGEEISVTGTIIFDEGTLRLDGHLEGKIISQGMLIIGEKGSLRGEIETGSLLLCGRVDGKVKVSGLVHITPTGKLFGKVGTHLLVMDAGAILEGESETVLREEYRAVASAG